METKSMSINRRNLKDMTLAELWEFFPIVFSQHRPEWKVWASEEIDGIKEMLVAFSPVINHVGSTAIPGICAKPIIDLLVEIPDIYDLASVASVLENAGYICMSQSSMRVSLNKGYTPDGYAERVFHIHIRRIGDNDEICFRDYLISHPDLAKEYEKLKLSLLPKYVHDRDAYTEAKSEFVARVIRLAKHCINVK